MITWESSRQHVGVNAPVWLTFDVHRPYLDGAASARTAIQALGPVLAAELFTGRDPVSPRLSMTMPLSYRQLLTRESRLAQYRVALPTDLPAALASPAWAAIAEAFAHRADLDATDRSGLAQWLVSACLPDAMLVLAPADLSPEECADPLAASVQLARAIALFQREGLSERTKAARLPLLEATVPTPAQLNGVAGWAYLTARHGADDSRVAELEGRAWDIFRQLAPGMDPRTRAVREARLLIKETMHAERHGQLDRATDLLAAARALVPDDGTLLARELRRRVIDRGVEIAVKRKDLSTERALVEEGLALDPWCVKIRMQAAQAAERRGEDDAALAGYLHAARLGPYGTAFALLRANELAQRLGQPGAARTFAERAFRAMPTSPQTLEAVLSATDSEPLAAIAKSTATGRGLEGNWHYQMYGAYFNLADSKSPCLYANLPLYAYEFAERGQRPRIGHQRIMPPAFRANLFREAGLPEFMVSHPAELPEPLWTDRWAKLCEWTTELPVASPERQYLTMHLLFRLGFQRLALDLVPAYDDPQSAAEFKISAWRHLIGYAASVGSRSPESSLGALALADRPGCPFDLAMTLSLHAVVYHARATRDIKEMVKWRDRAKDYHDTALASPDYTPFEKAMLESRFYRGTSFVPFQLGDRAGTIAELDRAEELARAVPATTPWEQFLKLENLHACLESRSKEAFGLGEIDLGHARTLEFLAIDPYDPKSHIELAESYTRQGKFAEAAEAYLTTARLGPLGTAIAYAMAGECYERAGQQAIAEDCFIQALRHDPYAISAARGWRRNGDDFGYTAALEEWGASR
ncbi:tetratricopeptide repeat protein [Longispora albida]|uniref:tetratricopeptide repeat protein n=1 Tax=Longispora albida TaxID=203523 RepID=UPI0003613DD1|nr:tetratricopeptide repeat protein [Longispora albida]